MILVVFILLLTSIRILQPLEIIENDQFDVLESWGISRVKRQKDDKGKDKDKDKVEKDVLSKFKAEPVKKRTCDELYKTRDSPFVAIVLFKSSGRLLCMGSIVDNQHVLTSKRCYDKIETRDLLVVLGYYKPWWGRNSQVIKVKKIIRHEYVIALLRLDGKIRFTSFVQPVKLPPSHTRLQKKFEAFYPPPYFVAGFVVDRYDVPGEPFDKEKVYEIKEDKLVKFDECKKNYTKLTLESVKLFCTIGNATYCWGGWGSPVLQWKTEYFLQVGVVIADNCTSDTTGPFLVARTDVYGDWIRGNSYQGHQPS